MRRNDPAQTGLASWGRERRLAFIDFRLLWDGAVNRTDLVRFFRISTQQASADLAEYFERAPGNAQYDKSLKTYAATPEFAPILVQPNASAYLSELASITSGILRSENSFVGWQPPFDSVRFPVRPLGFPILKDLLDAIRSKEDLNIEYQSLRRPQMTQRWIAPHALASDGQRFHVRAWCHENRDFRDFVISRIGAIRSSRPSAIQPADDAWWSTFIQMVVTPRTELTESQRRAISNDFGMTNGRLKMRCRKALAFYLLRQLRLDQPTAPATEQPLQLIESQDVTDVLRVGRKPTTNSGESQ